MKRAWQTLIGRGLFVAGILLSLATFVLQAIPGNWGLFMSTACFIIGSLFWPGWGNAAVSSDQKKDDLQ